MLRPTMDFEFTSASLIVLALATSVGLLSIKFLCVANRKRVRYPPGPPSVPILGNLLHIPLQHPWIELTKMKDEYGDLIYFHGLGNTILVLNDLETMLDLLSRKGNTYCGRPYLVVACELMELVYSTAFAPFGSLWQLHRKLIRAALSPQAVKGYDGVLMDISALLNRSLRDSPTDFIDHARLAAGRVIMSIIYGIDVQSAEDPYIVQAEAAMTMISKAVIPGAFIVDLLPALKYIPSWFPFTRFHKVGREGREMIAELVRKPYQYVLDEMAAGIAPPSFTRDVLTNSELESERKTDPDFEHAAKWAAASMYAGETFRRFDQCISHSWRLIGFIGLAGQEVISSSILNMIMALAIYPEKMKIAQAELDRVVGRTRCPTFEDRQSLPYVHAIVKETLRWHPPLPMDIARSSIQDGEYRGYFIPKGTTVIPNIWAIAHAPDPDYPPHTFAPERFLPGRPNPPPEPSSYCFGFGRRICPGRALAENSVFLMTASIIHAFDVSHAVDKNGSQVPIDVKYSSGLVSLPEDFKCNIQPRAAVPICA